MAKLYTLYGICGIDLLFRLGVILLPGPRKFALLHLTDTRPKLARWVAPLFMIQMDLTKRFKAWQKRSRRSYVVVNLVLLSALAVVTTVLNDLPLPFTKLSSVATVVQTVLVITLIAASHGDDDRRRRRDDEPDNGPKGPTGGLGKTLDGYSVLDAADDVLRESQSSKELITT